MNTSSSCHNRIGLIALITRLPNLRFRPRRFKFSAAYRATDLKKLVEDPNEDFCNDELDGNVSGIQNPFFVVGVDKPDTKKKKKALEKVPEGNLLDL